jgi:hypothetical protein
MAHSNRSRADHIPRPNGRNSTALGASLLLRVGQQRPFWSMWTNHRPRAGGQLGVERAPRDARISLFGIADQTSFVDFLWGNNFWSGSFFRFGKSAACGFLPVLVRRHTRRRGGAWRRPRSPVRFTPKNRHRQPDPPRPLSANTGSKAAHSITSSARARHLDDGGGRQAPRG